MVEDIEEDLKDHIVAIYDDHEKGIRDGGEGHCITCSKQGRSTNMRSNERSVTMI